MFIFFKGISAVISKNRLAIITIMGYYENDFFGLNHQLPTALQR